MNDFVIVGYVPAGARSARRAAKNGHDVVVLEQGEIGVHMDQPMSLISREQLRALLSD